MRVLIALQLKTGANYEGEYCLYGPYRNNGVSHKNEVMVTLVPNLIGMHFVSPIRILFLIDAQVPPQHPADS